VGLVTTESSRMQPKLVNLTVEGESNGWLSIKVSLCNADRKAGYPLWITMPQEEALRLCADLATVSARALAGIHGHRGAAAGAVQQQTLEQGPRRRAQKATRK
jgi:hypothetical protein